MPADDYVSAAGAGALKLKGGKIQKNKKKKKTKAPTLERSLTPGDSSTSTSKPKDVEDPGQRDSKDADDGGEGEVVEQKTEAERRYEEANRKKVCFVHIYDKRQTIGDDLILILISSLDVEDARRSKGSFRVSKDAQRESRRPEYLSLQA